MSIRKPLKDDPRSLAWKMAKQAMETYCQYKNHIVTASPGTLKHYEDSKRGITPIDICDECLIEHLSKHYKDSPNYVHLVNQHPEWYQPGSFSCGSDCHIAEPYGFVPEAGCPVHDGD